MRARGLQLGLEPGCAVVGQRLEHFFFRPELIMEGAAREISAANDARPAGALVTQLRNPPPRRREDCLAVCDLGALALTHRLNSRGVRHLSSRNLALSRPLAA